MENPLRALFERRSIGSSHELWEHLAKGTRSLAGVTVSESTAMQIAAVMTCVNGISADISSLPIDVIERVDERKRVPAVNHPIRRVLSQPNSWQTMGEWLAMQVAHILLRGNAYNLIVRSSLTSNGSEQITELLPLHPDQVSVEQKPYPDLRVIYTWTSQDGRRYEFVNGGGAPPQILHFRGLSTRGALGRSVLDDARDVFGVALATQHHAATFWSKGGLPTVALRHPKTLGGPGSKAQTNLEKSWAEIYGGGEHQSRVAVLEEGMEITTLSVTQQDAQFLETRRFQRGEIFGLFRYPQQLGGDGQAVSNWGTGVEQQQIGYVVFGLGWIIRRIEERMMRDLLTNRERFSIKLFVQGFMRGDASARSNYYWRMVQMGAMSPNDVRMLEDMNPIDDGDVYLAPVNYAPLGQIGDIHAQNGNAQ